MPCLMITDVAARQSTTCMKGTASPKLESEFSALCIAVSAWLEVHPVRDLVSRSVSDPYRSGHDGPQGNRRLLDVSGPYRSIALPGHDHFLRLVQQLLHPLLYLLLLLFFLDSLLDLLPTRLPLFRQFLHVPRSPGIPLRDLPLSLSELLGGPSVLLGSILFVELTGILFELFSDLLLGFFGDECRGSRSPEELLEFLLRLLNELLTFEVPDREAGFRLRCQLDPTVPKDAVSLQIVAMPKQR